MDKKELEKIAYLSRLKLPDEQMTADMVVQMNKILNFVDVLNEVNTDDVLPMHSSLNDKGQLRKDQAVVVSNKKELQCIAPIVEQDLYLVPKVIE